jgi:hypothetical protein
MRAKCSGYKFPEIVFCNAFKMATVVFDPGKRGF